MSNLANVFNLYANSIQKRTQLAYQQAMTNMQAQQQGELANRQMLITMIGNDQKYLQSLRKEMRSFNKTTSETKNNTEYYKAVHALSSLTNAYNSTNAKVTKQISDQIKELNKDYNIDPTVNNLINIYLNENKAHLSSASDQVNFDRYLGIQGKDPSNTALNKLQNSFTRLNDNQKKVAFYNLQQRMLNRDYPEDTINNMPVAEYINKELGKKLEIPVVDNAHAQITPQEIADIKKQRKQEIIDSAEGEETIALKVYDQIISLDRTIDSLKQTNPELATSITTIKSNMDAVSKEIEDTKTRLMENRASLKADRPSIDPLDVQTGRILLDQDMDIQKQANEEMKSALTNMSDFDKEVLSIYDDAKSLDLNKDDAEKQFFNTYKKSLNGENTGKLDEYFKYLNNEDMPEDKKTFYKQSALARILKAAEQETKSDPANAYKDAKPKQTSKKIQTQRPSLMQLRDWHSYGYVKMGTNPDGTPQLMMVPKGKKQAYLNTKNVSERRAILKPVPTKALQEAMDVYNTYQAKSK